MPTLMIQHNKNGRGRRCDATCHGASGTRCTCICGGLFHGMAYAEAKAKINRQLAMLIVKNYPGTHIRFPSMQMSLFS